MLLFQSRRLGVQILRRKLIFILLRKAHRLFQTIEI